ncbi:hypothetical protein [Streptomyces asiaticus]
MNGFLTALGGKLAERWTALLVLPGLLYLAALVTAIELGHSHWHDVDRLLTLLDTVAASPSAHTAGTIVLAAAAVLIGAFLIDLAVRALGSVLERLWLMDPRRALSRHLAQRRRRRWEAADTAFRAALAAAGRARISGRADATALADEAIRHNATRNRLGLAPPSRPFWAGDRLAAVDHRVWQSFRLDLTFAWPRLWLLIEDTARLEIHSAREALAAAARLHAWTVAYAVIGILWWPAALTCPVLFALAVSRGHTAVETLAELAEAAVDLRLRALASDLGIECPGPLTPETGEAITRVLRKGA